MFRTISVQHEKIIQTCDFFRTISVHFSANSGNLFFFPEHVRSQKLLSCSFSAAASSFSGACPFTHSKSSTIFALENQNKTVQIWQEQLKI